jgi:hypothetical protein
MAGLARALVAIPLLALIACGPVDRTNTLKEAWDASNRPQIMGGGYDFRLEALPTQGQHSGPAWSGDYWPTYLGGIAQRWMFRGDLAKGVRYPLIQRHELEGRDLSRLSPAEKYDLYAGDYNYSVTQLERARTRVLDAAPGSIARWEGLCHGWAPASVTWQEPRPVTLTSKDGIKIPFGSADVKALLTLAMHEGKGSRQDFLGRRCEADFGRLQTELNAGRITREQYRAQVESLSCRDSNAGAFHVVLTNELGLRKTSFLMDMTPDVEVWNQALVSYRSQVGSLKKQKSTGAAAETVYEVDVTSTVTYITELASEWEAHGPQDRSMLRDVVYRYRLELNAAREIVGGQWTSEKHPDFLWRQTRPFASRLLAKLPEIYKAATGDEFHAGGQIPSDEEPEPSDDHNPIGSPVPEPGSCAPNDPWCF